MVSTKTHGHSFINRRPSSTYTVWKSMKQRTCDPRCKSFGQYGGRGITVCAGWRDSFSAFLSDMGERPAKHSIDRVDNDGGYWCGRCHECAKLDRRANCRWATRTQQSQNRGAYNAVTVDLVNEIRGRREHGEPVRSIAQRLNLNLSTTWDVVRGRSWKEELL